MPSGKAPREAACRPSHEERVLPGSLTRSRRGPLIKCTVNVDRTFVRVVPGGVVSMTMPEYTISGKSFRVAYVERGTLENGRIRLGLLEDIFAIHRGSVMSIPFPGGFKER
jgi:hypothetical protein